MVAPFVKVMIIGEAGAGKTSLIRRFVGGGFESGFVSTLGVDFKIKDIVVDGEKIKLQIWDTAGQERFRTMARAYYKNARVILVAFDPTSINPIAGVDVWLNEAEKYASEKAVRILVATKSDLEGTTEDNRDPNMKRVIDRVRENHADLTFFNTSSKTDYGIDALFEYVARVGKGVKLRAASNAAPPRVRRIQKPQVVAPPKVAPVRTPESARRARALMVPRFAAEPVPNNPANLRATHDARTLLPTFRFEKRFVRNEADLVMLSPYVISTMNTDGAYAYDDLPRVRSALLAYARGSDVALLQENALGISPWQRALDVRAAHRRALALVDVNATPVLTHEKSYTIGTGDDAKLGTGSFGCVFKAQSTDRATKGTFALKATFFARSSRVDVSVVAAEKIRARLEIAFPAILTAACRHATPYLPDGTSGYIANSANMGDDLDNALHMHCFEFVQGGALMFGVAVTAMPVFDVGDFMSPGTRNIAVDSAAFQLVHQLLAFNTTVGFGHHDIKGANIFVRSKRTAEHPGIAGEGAILPADAAEHRLRVRYTNAEGTVSERVLVDKSRHVSVFGDFGLSSMDHVPRFTLSAQRPSRTQRSLHTRYGTAIFVDPTAAMFYDSFHPQQTERQLNMGTRPRGFAADIWALALALLEQVTLRIATMPPAGRRVYKHIIPATADDPQSMLDVINAFRKISDTDQDSTQTSTADTGLIGDPSIQPAEPRISPQDAQADAKSVWGEHTARSKMYYARTFMHSLLLHKAFTDKWPDATLGTGPNWKYAMLPANLAKLEDAYKVHAWGDVIPYNRMVDEIRKHSIVDGAVEVTPEDKGGTSGAEIVDFFARCFTFDTDARVAFFRSGEAFEHPFLRNAVEVVEIRPWDAAEAAAAGASANTWTHALDLVSEP